MIRHLLTGREFDRAALEQLIETTARLKAGCGKAVSSTLEVRNCFRSK